MKGETDIMKLKVVIALSAVLLTAASLVAENVNGFENFVLSRNDWKSNPSSVIVEFSSRTRTEGSLHLSRFNSSKPTGMVLVIR